jgi:predicted signal transduction protein with EAL and GGDEF domain
MAIAVSLTAVMTLATVTLQLGTDLDAVVRVGHVQTLSLCAAIAISAFLSGALSYRSALLMKELTLTRAELFRISRTDKLTGLLNRRGFDEAAAVALQSAHAANRPVAAMMCDIDHFKAINDHYGTSLVTAYWSISVRCCRRLLPTMNCWSHATVARNLRFLQWESRNNKQRYWAKRSGKVVVLGMSSTKTTQPA